MLRAKNYQSPENFTPIKWVKWVIFRMSGCVGVKAEIWPGKPTHQTFHIPKI